MPKALAQATDRARGVLLRIYRGGEERQKICLNRLRFP
jgi:hypothetical protein